MKAVLQSIRLFAMLALVVSIAAQSPSLASLIIKTSPETIIWVDNLRYGAVPSSGELTVKNLRAGSHTVRARLQGKREIAQTITLKGGETQSIQLTLTAAADKAELSFQAAEALRRQGKHKDAIREYRNAIRLRPKGYPQARLGLARSLQVVDDYDDAIANVRQAMRENPAISAEAYTVLGNLRRAQGFTDDALKNYQTAIAKQALPEAHTGLALIYQDRSRPAETIKHFRLAIAAANDTEPILYFLVGNALEREYRFKEAVEVYEKYLQLEPQGIHAASVRSVVKQLKKEIR
jgi:tetratricopeptide (TPR) repeat protein